MRRVRWQDVLTYGTDFTADVSPDIDSGGKILRITPLKPFDFSRGPAVNDPGADAGRILNVGYLVVLHQRPQGDDAATRCAPTRFTPASRSRLPTAARSRTPTQKQVCLLFKAHLGIAQATGTNPADVVLSWSFSTQSINDSLNVIALTAAAQQTLIVPTGLTTQQANAGLQGKANIYVGSTRLPYYLTPAATPSGQGRADELLDGCRRARTRRWASIRPAAT